jgi:hypothetical protein
MTSVRKKTSSEICRTPRWLRGTPKSLRSMINPEEVSIYSRMRKAIIQELRPKTPIEWILVNEYVNAQFSQMRYGTWQESTFSTNSRIRTLIDLACRLGIAAECYEQSCFANWGCHQSPGIGADRFRTGPRRPRRALSGDGDVLRLGRLNGAFGSHGP